MRKLRHQLPLFLFALFGFVDRSTTGRILVRPACGVITIASQSLAGRAVYLTPSRLRGKGASDGKHQCANKKSSTQPGGKISAGRQSSNIFRGAGVKNGFVCKNSSEKKESKREERKKLLFTKEVALGSSGGWLFFASFIIISFIVPSIYGCVEGSGSNINKKKVQKEKEFQCKNFP